MNNIDGQKFQIKRFDKFETGPNTKYVIFLKDFYLKKKKKEKRSDIVSVRTANKRATSSPATPQNPNTGYSPRMKTIIPKVPITIISSVNVKQVVSL